MNVKKLTGKVAVVTGAASGIGRETALLCARRGAFLALCDIDQSGLQETAELARAFGVEVMTEHVDIADDARMKKFAEVVHKRWGAADLLVNNAGIGLVAGFSDTTLDDWNRLISINLMGVVNGCRYFVPRMIDQGRRGHVVNVSSLAGLWANPTTCAYSTTKFAVVGFSEALRMELRPHRIGVSVVCPGVVNTPITSTSVIRGDNADAVRTRLTGIYARRNYGPEQAADRILRGVNRDQAVVLVTSEAHIMHAVTRFCPPLARFAAARVAALAQRQ
ncbi:SDR family NAD(P)-dependent oxidoreductase [Nocardia sp. NPDC055029]